MTQEILASLRTRRVAIVHDFLLYPGGAERVLLAIMALFPDAPIYTLLHDPRGMAPLAQYFAHRTIRTSFLQSLPLRRPAALLPLLPTAPEAFDLRDYDLVISSSGAWSKGIVTRSCTTHVAYIHSPMRFVWDENIRYARQRLGRQPGMVMRRLFSRLRIWDFEAAQRPDLLVANSAYTAARIKKFYRRDARVVYPGVRPCAHAAPARTERFLTVARLSAYKNVTLIADVCARHNLPLDIVGAGRMLRMLRRRYAATCVRVHGYVSDARLATFYAQARALIFAAEEDFGLVMAEALACGTPVIAYGRGGAREIVTPGVTGEFFMAQTPEVVADSLRRFLLRLRAGGYDSAVARSHVAARFSPTQFRDGMVRAIADAVALTEAV